MQLPGNVQRGLVVVEHKVRAKLLKPFVELKQGHCDREREREFKENKSNQRRRDEKNEGITFDLSPGKELFQRNVEGRARDAGNPFFGGLITVFFFVLLLAQPDALLGKGFRGGVIVPELAQLPVLGKVDFGEVDGVCGEGCGVGFLQKKR